MSGYRLGIDVGGTFTDAACLDPAGRLHALKVLTTYPDPATGVAEALDALAGRLGLDARHFIGAIDTIVHGTTVTTNALLTGGLARTGLVTTEGFRDSLELRKGYRASMYDNRHVAPAPLVPRELRLGVDERTGTDGDELRPLDDAALSAAAATLTAAGVEAVAVCFLHAYANPRHERVALERLRSLLGPDVYVTASTDLLARMGFYERTSTVAVNAGAGPLFRRYLASLAGRLADLGFHGVLLIMQSSGGMASLSQSAGQACNSLLSGPAGGVVAAQRHARTRAYRYSLSMDMGGTSFDLCAIEDGEPLITTDSSVGSYRVATPMVDIRTIGAGGGSVAWVDTGGLIRVGPASAGSDPGPACYGRGGTRPTVTDANLVIGYLDPADFWGGQLPLDRQAAADAIARDVAEPLGCSIEAAAWGIFRVVSVNMTAAARQLTVERGNDPRQHVLILGGGAGPIHASALLTDLGADSVLIPPRPAVLSASGMLMADARDTQIRSLAGDMAEIDPTVIRAQYADMARAGRRRLAADGWPGAELRFSLELRYLGQLYSLEVPLTEAEAQGDLAVPVERFHQQHRARYGYAVPGATVELTNLRMTAFCPTSWLSPEPLLPEPLLPETPAAGAGPGRGATPLGRRPAWFDATRHDAVPVFDARRLAPGAVIRGPALVSMASSATVVDPGLALLAQGDGGLVLSRGGPPAAGRASPPVTDQRTEA
jgi:N-methylhydantoinase A